MTDLPWDSPELRPSSEPARTARYRRLQSWYRQERLGVAPGAHANYPGGLGNLLDAEAVRQDDGLNFLSDEARDHARARAQQVQTEGGSLETERLFHNLLSSMPLCFNLFGHLRSHHDAFLPVLTQLFDPEATAIDDVVCEWAPADRAAMLGDRTAFDAVVFYRAGDEQRFLGIETKYTEPFSQKDYRTERYERVTRESGWFATDASLDDLASKPANQLWRNVMLAAALERSGEHGRGSVAVVALADDPGVTRAVSIVRPALAETHADRLVSVSLESIVAAAAAQPAVAAWAARFEERYLDLSPLG